MLNLSNISHSFSGRKIFENLNLSIMDGWKVGVVGANGVGKSTLFKIISGELAPDDGKIKLAAGERMGMVTQELDESDDDLISIVLKSDAELYGLLQKIEDENADPNLLGDIYMRLEQLDGYMAEPRAKEILSGLGFSDDEMYLPLKHFSGGWRMRVALAGALFMAPDILLLDEPTNHLDLEAIMWLENYLENYPKSLLMISHDREILNKSVGKILHIEQQKVTIYTGNYDQFEQERALKRGLQQKVHEKQQKQRAHLQSFVDRFKAKASKAKQAQSRVKALARMELVDAILEDPRVQFRFPNPEKIAPQLLTMQEVEVGYEAQKPILINLNETIEAGDRIALMGSNGSGKSTFMKLIAGALNPEIGQMVRANKLKIGYFAQHQSDELPMDSTPYQALQAYVSKQKGDLKESVLRAKLGQFAFNKDLSDTKIAKLSGGEKARLLFAFMSLNTPHLLLMDEPTNHLDVAAREALVRALTYYEGAVILVSHDPAMIERVAERLWLIDEGTCKHFQGDLEDYRNHILASRKQDKKIKKTKKPKETMPVIEVSKPKKIDREAEKKLKKAEKQLAALESEKIKLEGAICAPDALASPALLLQLQTQYQACLDQLQHAEEIWLGLSNHV